MFLVTCPVFDGLWNPSVRRKLVLRAPLLEGGKCRCFSALGYNPKTNDYKVLCIAYERMDDGSDCSEVRVYSVKEGAWRVISAPAPPCDIGNCMLLNVVVNGSLHWIADSIMLFDTVDEVFRRIMLPKSLMTIATHNLSLKVIRGSLSVIEYDKFFNLRSIWVMKEYGVVESWIKKFSFDFEGGG